MDSIELNTNKIIENDLMFENCIVLLEPNCIILVDKKMDSSQFLRNNESIHVKSEFHVPLSSHDRSVLPRKFTNNDRMRKMNSSSVRFGFWKKEDMFFDRGYLLLFLLNIFQNKQILRCPEIS